MSPAPPPKPPSLLRNSLSLLGIVVAVTSTAFGLPLMFADMLSRRTHPYLGVVVYLVLPFAAAGGGRVWPFRRGRASISTGPRIRRP